MGVRQGTVEGLVGLRDRPVFVTGHTGFKGGWLSLWLAGLGARVHGYALAPNTEPNLFEVARVAEVLESETRGDLGDLPALTAALERSQPEVVFHLAAQTLVREGYRDPIGTIKTNVLGTANLLEAVRTTDSVRAVVVVATDKVYENLDTGHAYGEDDLLGGHDPYGGSKAAAEIIVASYRSSFFGDRLHPARIATARAGNVIGGGDWSADRLVPDCLRAFASGEAVHLRSPRAIRPWQHVLEPLSGYLALATRLLNEGGSGFAHSWNFGPGAADDATVGDIANRVAKLWGPGASVEHVRDPRSTWNEAALLRLDSSLARAGLDWRTRWSLEEALAKTVAWHKAWFQGDDMQAACRDQIATYDGTGIQ